MRFLRRMLIFIIGLAVLLWLVSLNAGRRPEKFEYGVTFSIPQSERLELDWKRVYNETLEDLGVKHLRLMAYWNRIELRDNEFNFEDLDYQLNKAQEHGAKVVLVIGRKLPRWPECHEPEWAKELSKENFDMALLSYIETVVVRYYNHPAVAVWQVENEPFLMFGECEGYNADLLDREISLIKKLDPTTPIIITDSGEINFWIKAGSRGDVFGTTLYRYVFSDVFNRYWQNYIPFWFYRVKGGFLRLLHPDKKIVIIELQAEPWTTQGIVNTEIAEQFKTMSLKKFEKLQSVARATGFSPQYFWGVEWWYWMKEVKGHPEFWEKAKQLMQN